MYGINKVILILIEFEFAISYQPLPLPPVLIEWGAIRHPPREIVWNASHHHGPPTDRKALYPLPATPPYWDSINTMQYNTKYFIVPYKHRFT